MEILLNVYARFTISCIIILFCLLNRKEWRKSTARGLHLSGYSGNSVYIVVYCKIQYKGVGITCYLIIIRTIINITSLQFSLQNVKYSY